jgi:hypothetical protein
MIRKPLLLTVFMAFIAMTAFAQDSLWVKYQNRFKDNRFLFSMEGLDSVELLGRGTTLPVLRRYSSRYSRGYQDYRLTGMFSSDSCSLVIGDPGRILWKTNVSDNNYNNDYMNPNSRWCFKHSKESEHFVVYWDSKFGDNPNSPSVSANLRVDVDDLLRKAEMFYTRNVDSLKMVTTGGGRSQLDHYKMGIYLLYQTDWLAVGSGFDNVIGTLWVNPSTCHPVGSTIGHEIGHCFQYQGYCDRILNGGSDNFHSNFRYGYPKSNGGCGFWEQCAQFQSFQDYPSEAITSYNFSVWLANCHRHFEHEWQRYASYFEQYYWLQYYGNDALGQIWNKSVYPEDANQAFMRIYLGNNYDSLRTVLFDYARKTATFDYNRIRAYVGASTIDRYTVATCDTTAGWHCVAYSSCPQPTGFNVIKVNNFKAGSPVTFHFKGLPVGSPLVSTDPGKQVDGDGKTVATVNHFNTTDLAGNEGWAYGFVAYMNDGSRVYGPSRFVNAANQESELSFTVPSGVRRLLVVVQGSPMVYRQCPWDEKESTDDQLPYLYKID